MNLIEYSDKCYQVFSSVFGETISNKSFYHKHFENPNRQNMPIRACIKDDHIVGINAFMKVDIIDNSSGNLIIHSVSQSNDTAVLKEYRGQHIFSDLILEELEQHDTEYVIGIPNDNSYPGFIKMGWGEVCEFTNYCYPLKVFKLIFGKNFISSILDSLFRSLFLHKVFSQNGDCYQIDSFDRLLLNKDEWAEINNSFEVGMYRSQEYIDWKTLNNGLKPKCLVFRDKGALVGYVIYHIEKRLKGQSARIDDFYMKDGYNIWYGVYRFLYDTVDIVEDPLVNYYSKDVEKLVSGGMKDIRKIDKNKKKQKLIASPNGKNEKYIKRLQMRMIDFDTYLNH